MVSIWYFFLINYHQHHRRSSRSLSIKISRIMKAIAKRIKRNKVRLSRSLWYISRSLFRIISILCIDVNKILFFCCLSRCIWCSRGLLFRKRYHFKMAYWCFRFTYWAFPIYIGLINKYVHHWWFIWNFRA